MNIESLIPHDIVAVFNQYRTYLIGAGVTIVGIISFAVYYHMSSIKHEESAQMALAETLQEFARAHELPELWTDVEIAAKTGYRQYKSTALSPYFLTLEAHALAQLDRLPEAIEVMKQAVNVIPTKSPLYYVSAIKLARMKLDAPEEGMKQEGFTELKKLAELKTNPQQDQALYYLGNYYQTANQSENAQSAFKQLVELFQGDKMPSPWAQLAQKELQESA